MPTQIQELQDLLDAHRDQRVSVIAPTSVGKSTFLQYIKNAHDQDELVFPRLTQEESDYVCQTPWTEEIGEKMTELVKKYVEIKPGEPVFGTVVLPCDLIVYLKIDEELWRERVEKRGGKFEDADNMRKRIERDIEDAGVPVIEFTINSD